LNSISSQFSSATGSSNRIRLISSSLKLGNTYRDFAWTTTGTGFGSGTSTYSYGLAVLIRSPFFKRCHSSLSCSSFSLRSSSSLYCSCFNLSASRRARRSYRSRRSRSSSVSVITDTSGVSIKNCFLTGEGYLNSALAFLFFFLGLTTGSSACSSTSCWTCSSNCC
jgi:hypothetical protein